MHVLAPGKAFARLFKQPQLSVGFRVKDLKYRVYVPWEVKERVLGNGSCRWRLVGRPLYLQRDEHLKHFDDSVNAVSFGFVATAILISMFILMAIFEKFLRTTSPEVSPPRGGLRGISDVEAQSHARGLNSKLGSNSPKGFQISIQPKIISVLMPGDCVPKFIAHPAPVPLPPEHVSWPSHQRERL